MATNFSRSSSGLSGSSASRSTRALNSSHDSSRVSPVFEALRARGHWIGLCHLGIGPHGRANGSPALNLDTTGRGSSMTDL